MGINHCLSCLLPQKFSLQRHCRRGGEHRVIQKVSDCAAKWIANVSRPGETHKSSQNQILMTTLLSTFIYPSTKCGDLLPDLLSQCQHSWRPFIAIVAAARLLSQRCAPSASSSRNPGDRWSARISGIAPAVGLDNDELAVAPFGQEVAVLVSSHLLRWLLTPGTVASLVGQDSSAP